MHFFGVGWAGALKPTGTVFSLSSFCAKRTAAKKGVDPKNRNWFFFFGQDRRRKEETDGFFGRIFFGVGGKRTVVGCRII